MAAAASKSAATVVVVPEFVKTQLEGAKKRFTKLEREMVKEGRAQQRELDAFFTRLAKRADGVVAGAMKRVTGLKANALAAVGIASSDEVTRLSSQVQKLNKKLDTLTKSTVSKAS
jgi:hypothetical protein